MKTKEDVESYLMRMGVPYADTGDNTWVITGADGVENMAIAFDAGFGDLSTFNARFRETFGASPSAFRVRA